jgi:hypothetical protein
MQSRLFILLLKPSLFSGITAVVITLLVIGIANWPYFTYTTALYPLLYGDFGVVTALEQSPALTKNVQDAFARGAFLVVRGVRGGTHTVSALENANERKNTLQLLGERLGILAVWILYTVISVTIIFPFCLLLSRIGADVITSPQGIFMNVGAFLLCIVSLHVHVIFFRLFLLRPRVFGGNAAIESAAFYHR